MERTEISQESAAPLLETSHARALLPNLQSPSTENTENEQVALAWRDHISSFTLSLLLLSPCHSPYDTVRTQDQSSERGVGLRELQLPALRWTREFPLQGHSITSALNHTPPHPWPMGSTHSRPSFLLSQDLGSFSDSDFLPSSLLFSVLCVLYLRSGALIMALITEDRAEGIASPEGSRSLPFAETISFLVLLHPLLTT